MSFLTINGLDVDAFIENFDRTYDDVQTFDRSEGTTYEGALYATKRSWAFETPWDGSVLKNVSIRDWCKGRGHYFTFDRVDGATTRFNKYSAEGGPGFSANFTAGTPAKFGSWAASCASGFTSAVTASFGSDNRYSASLWKRDSANAYILTSVVSDGATVRYYAGADGKTVTTAFAWATVTAVSGYLSLTLTGKDQTGGAATANYDGLMMVPYALTTTQLAARNARTLAEPVFPYVEGTGDFIDDLNPITLKIFVENEPTRQGLTSGTVQVVRYLKMKMIEK